VREGLKNMLKFIYMIFRLSVLLLGFYLMHIGGISTPAIIGICLISYTYAMDAEERIEKRLKP
jgi:hypothetical protein